MCLLYVPVARARVVGVLVLGAQVAGACAVGVHAVGVHRFYVIYFMFNVLEYIFFLQSDLTSSSNRFI